MSQITLTGFEKKEIENISGKGIAFKKIKIPSEDCSNFQIQYEIINQKSGERFSSPIDCVASPYQKDVTQVTLYTSVLIPDNCILNLQMVSVTKPAFIGVSYIDYEIFIPTTEPQKKSGINVFISEDDRQNAFRVALVNLARFFKIPNWEYDNNQTLYSKIISLDNPLYTTIVELLQNYFTAYNAWFGFYARIKEIEAEQGQGHTLTPVEKNDLALLIKNREDTLNALQKEFDRLQFERFKEINGLKHIKGIEL